MKRLFSLFLAAAVVLPAAAAAAPKSAVRPVRSGVTSVAQRTKPMPPLVASRQNDDLSRALDHGSLSEAEYALERAHSLFALGRVRARYGRVARPDPHSATMILRDLAIRQRALQGNDRAAADALLARPTSPQSHQSYRPGTTQRTCAAGVCIHSTTTGSDAPPASQVEQALSVFGDVYTTEVTEFGYRPPKSDQTSPGNVTPELDVYLLDLGAQGLYGYCTTDDPNLESPTYPNGDMSAYCAVDNDFSPAQFGSHNTALENLQVTAAHEFFHAIQFAYDIYEDPWLMEGTASWIEDELFDDIDDNYQYLRQSHLTYPEVPLDTYVPPSEGAFMYGTWLFFRFITENIDSRDFIREVWVVADGAVGGQDRYSLGAIDQTLQAKGTNFRWAYADFAAANYVADSAYEEGAGYIQTVGGYPPEFVKKLTASRPRFNGYADLDHLTSSYVAFRPGRGIDRRAKLRVAVDTPPAIEGGEATVITLFKDETFRFAPLQMNQQGDGFIVVPFKRARVFQVAVILSNGSIRMRDCFQGATPFSCFGGTPLDDGTRYVVKVRVLS